MAHEDLNRTEHVEGSSDRAFGLVFAVAFSVIALWPVIWGASPRWWALWTAGSFLLVALLRPSLLRGLNRMWTKFGLLLGRVVSPLALGLLFFGVFVPLGAVVRWIGTDPLRLKWDRAAASYWIRRNPPGPPPGSLTDQF